ncbi:hypothetical protein JCM11641_003164 [Rhodosporidiobolus odoratus]
MPASLPLHSRQSTPQSAPFSPPLQLVPSPTHSPQLPTASTSSYAQVSPFTTSPTTSRAPSPTQRVRSRRSTQPDPPSSSSTPASPKPFSTPDITRPTLRGRIANDALAAGTALRGKTGDDYRDGYVLRGDLKGKGKARDTRRAVSETGPAGGAGSAKDREVIVHKLAKTDSLASISLQYGITPQNIRSSNRLWPSDPIHLRSQLLIPLDLCNLPSSSFGVERIAREENGDLTVWQRHTGAAAQEGSGGALGRAAERAEKEEGLVSPTARRLVSTSAFELSSGASTPPLPSHGGGNEFLDIWSSPSLSSGTSPRASLEVPLPSSSAVTDYLSSTNNAFSVTPSPPPPTNEELVFRTVSPPESSASNSFSRPSSSAATSPPPPGSINALDSNRLEKRTLRVERLPASQLAFFPAPSAEPSSSSSKKPSFSQPPRAQDESLFFGPLTNSLTSSFSALGLNKYLTLPSSFSSGSGSGSGGIRLPPSPAPSRVGGRTPTSTMSGGPRTVKSKWSLLNFGAEEEAASTTGGGVGDYFGLPASSSSSSASAAAPVNLSDLSFWGSSSSSKPLPPHPPLPPGSPGGSPRQQRHPRGAKVRDSNERVYEGPGWGGGGGKERGKVRGLFE